MRVKFYSSIHAYLEQRPMADQTMADKLGVLYNNFNRMKNHSDVGIIENRDGKILAVKFKDFGFYE